MEKKNYITRGTSKLYFVLITKFIKVIKLKMRNLMEANKTQEEREICIKLC